jgi:hypothetical protein
MTPVCWRFPALAGTFGDRQFVTQAADMSKWGSIIRHEGSVAE